MAKHSSVTLKSTRGRFLPSPASSSLASQIERILFKRGYSRDGNEESAQTGKTTWRKKSRRSLVNDGRWTIVNADDMLAGQGRSFLIPNYIRDVSMKVTRRTNERSTETRWFFYILDILRLVFFLHEQWSLKIEENNLPTESKFNGETNTRQRDINARSKFAELRSE